MSDRLSSPLLDAPAARVVSAGRDDAEMRGMSRLPVRSTGVTRKNVEELNFARDATERDHLIVQAEPRRDAPDLLTLVTMGHRRGEESGKLGYRGARFSVATSGPSSAIFPKPSGLRDTEEKP
jgi:hypothetical protein